MQHRLKTFLAAAAAALIVPATCAAEELRLAHFLAPTHPYHPQLFVPFAAEIEKATAGKLKVRIFPGGELGSNPGEQFNRAADGIADIAFVIPGYTAANFPRTLVMEYPGVAKTAQSAPRGLWKARELLQDEYKRVKLLSLWTNTPAAIYSRDKPVRALADLNGMKLRVPSNAGAEIVRAWGATPVFTPVTEVYNAMQTGVIDGVLIDGGGANAFKLSEVSKHVTVGMKSMQLTFALVMNRDSWSRLPAQHKAAIDQATGLAMAERAYSIWENVAEKGLQLIAASPGKELIRLPAAEAAKFDAASQKALHAALAQLEAKRIPAKRIAQEMAGE